MMNYLEVHNREQIDRNVLASALTTEDRKVVADIVKRKK